MPHIHGTTDLSITTTLSFPNQFLHDILTTAVEGGINYWAALHVVSRDDDLNVLSVVLSDAEDDDEPQLIVNRDTIIKGIENIFNDKQLSHIHARLLKGEDFDYDADDADMIVQYGLFGQLVYS